METRTEKPNNNNVSKPQKNAYLWLAGIFAIVYAIIYIAMLLYVRFLTPRDGSYAMSRSSANLLFAFVLLVLIAALYLYTVISRRELLFSLKEAGAIMTVFGLVITVNIFLSYVDPYLMFMSLTAVLALPFSKKRDAFILNVFACLISAFFLINATETEYAAIVFTAVAGVFGGAVGVYAFPSAITRMMSVFRSFVSALSVSAIYLIFLCIYSMSFQPFADNAMFIGISAAGHVFLCGIVEPIIETVFNITTDFKLVELTNHKAPLIHRLMVEAPGTFNHCLAVANFAEICASAIGEDPYLARASAYYHDIGKLNNAMYFAENQAGYNPHDDILPEVSAEIIRQHTVDGYKLCKEYRIPEEIARITIEHHGTLPITYFYNKAKSLTDSEVDLDEYRYRGDIPTGKIGAIIMLCDSAEAAIRAMDNPNGERVDKLLRNMIDERIKLGQFDNCDITMRDLTAMREAIVGGYGGLFHKRIKYNNVRGGGDV